MLHEDVVHVWGGFVHTAGQVGCSQMVQLIADVCLCFDRRDSLVGVGVGEDHREFVCVLDVPTSYLQNPPWKLVNGHMCIHRHDKCILHHAMTGPLKSSCLELLQ